MSRVDAGYSSNPRTGPKLHGFESSNIKQRRCAEGDREAVSRVVARRCLQHHGDDAKRFLFSAPAPPQGARYTRLHVDFLKKDMILLDRDLARETYLAGRSEPSGKKGGKQRPQDGKAARRMDPSVCSLSNRVSEAPLAGCRPGFSFT